MPRPEDAEAGVYHRQNCSLICVLGGRPWCGFKKEEEEEAQEKEEKEDEGGEEEKKFGRHLQNHSMIWRGHRGRAMATFGIDVSKEDEEEKRKKMMKMKKEKKKKEI